MRETEIIELINFSPTNLQEFFDNAVITQESALLPGYAVILQEPVTYRLSEGALISNDDVK